MANIDKVTKLSELTRLDEEKHVLYFAGIFVFYSTFKIFVLALEVLQNSCITNTNKKVPKDG
jgi:hypothetical protein